MSFLTVNQTERKLEFLKSVDALLTEIGAALAVPHEHRPTYVFPTRHGVLRIRPFAGKLAPKIYCRFVKPYWVREISGNFNRTNGTWNHYLWPDWRSADGSGLTIFVQRLQAIAMAHDPVSPAHKPFRRADGSVVRFCVTPAGEESVLITQTCGELYVQSPKHFREGKEPRIRRGRSWQFGWAIFGPPQQTDL